MIEKYSNESNQICDRYENICTNNLAFLTGATGARWFSTCTANPSKNNIDYNFISNEKTGKLTGKLELKTRKYKVDEFKDKEDVYPTIYIEISKFQALKSSKTIFKWYLNFFENSKEKFWLCDIDNLNESDLRIKLVEKLWDNATKSYKTEYRLCIPIIKGVYFEFNYDENKYIKKELNERTKRYIR